MATGLGKADRPAPTRGLASTVGERERNAARRQLSLTTLSKPLEQERTLTILIDASPPRGEAAKGQARKGLGLRAPLLDVAAKNENRAPVKVGQ